MKEFVVFVVLVLFTSILHAQNLPKWNIPTYNRTVQFNQTQVNNSLPNETNFNRTQWKLQYLNRTEFNRIQDLSKNKTRLKIQFLNTKWNSLSRPRRQEPWWIPAINATWNQTNPNGDVIIGRIDYLDRLLFQKLYRKERRWWSGREKIIEYPKDLGSNWWQRTENISAIRIYNKFYDGLASKAEIVNGGVGYRYVKIKLSSPWNKGFEYLVQIFGR